MKDMKWLINRLKAMNIQEIAWRIQQKILQKSEYRKFYALNLPVTAIPLKRNIAEYEIDIERLSINWKNTQYSLFEKLDLLGDYDYLQYRNQWNSGFQTENVWPENDFSYSIATSQREDIGDIRTNWELNRHFQFSALAKSYYVSGDKAYLAELKELFEDWNERNKFLHGVQWTSAMEVAIRVNSWVYTYAFLLKAQNKYGDIEESLLKSLRNGILTMTEYIVCHRARFSSANNHLVVEMYAVALVGIVCNCNHWKKQALNILTEELPRQNHPDGVNKEMSLHYQSFIMEAYGLLMVLMQKNRIPVPSVWRQYLSPMSEFLADSCGDYGEVVVFGDNDEGKILDLTGQHKDHYRYVLDLMSYVLSRRYGRLDDLDENLSWIIPDTVRQKSKENEQYTPALVRCYKEGGYTFLRSYDRKVLIGFDHAELGFGKLAAHGHADALSIQIFYEGKAILVDPGTYNYHVPRHLRDVMRSTAAHNTVYVEGLEQAEMLGPFLWGKRYKIYLQSVEWDETTVNIEAAMQFDGTIIERHIHFNFDREIIVEDKINANHNKTIFVIWNTPACLRKEDKVELEHAILISNGETYDCEDIYISPRYGCREIGKRLTAQITGSDTQTIICIC